MLEAGSSAPAFRIPDHHGDQVALEDYRGRWVVLWWYPKADTGG